MLGMTIFMMVRIFQINQNKFVPSTLMSQSQRQSATIHSQTNEYLSGRALCKQKKKIIKKERGIVESQSCNKLTKEQRMRIQKQKNRQAAQRSRDQHKQYVNSLQQQVKYLKEQVQINKKICYKCKEQFSNTQAFFQQPIKKQEFFQQEQLFMNLQPQQPSQDSQERIEPKVEDVEEYFIRGKEPEEDYSYIKMMLFVAMIVVGVMIFSGDSDTTEKGRNLVEIYKTLQSAPIAKDQFNMVSSDDYQGKQRYQLASSSGLVVRNQQINQKCLHSLLNYKQYPLTNLRTSQMSYDSHHNQGILLCSYQQPTIPPQRNSIQPSSSFLKLFMLGSQIKQLITLNSAISHLLQNKVQLNGIYLIGAQLKQIQLLSQHNCLL